MKTEVGFIGLGTMGKWMAFNLIKAGFPLKFFARKKPIIEETTRHEGRWVSSPRELATQTAWIFLCLPDTETVEEVLFGGEGMAGVLKPGQILIDCSTIHPLAARRIHKTLKDRGIHFLDAPISGMEARAKAGTLTIMVGGEESAYQQVRPALEAMGNTILYLGASGNGQIMKMIN
ncbi:MAG: NAD(P)-dependent oxidoreductase, partial [Deltaproteobacteria bacterium]|nr:NAD(P)-dependent oxidoreductase [Deltaproteobacteria bacterium]